MGAFGRCACGTPASLVAAPVARARARARRWWPSAARRQGATSEALSSAIAFSTSDGGSSLPLGFATEALARLHAPPAPPPRRCGVAPFHDATPSQHAVTPHHLRSPRCPSLVLHLSASSRTCLSLRVAARFVSGPFLRPTPTDVVASRKGLGDCGQHSIPIATNCCN